MLDTRIAHHDQKSKVEKPRLSDPYNIDEEHQLRRAIHTVFKTDPKNIASDLKLSYEFLNRVGSLHLPFRFSVRALLPLLRLTKDSRVLSFMAAQLGFQIYKLPEEIGSRELESALADFSMTISSVAQQTAEVNQKKDRRALEELEIRLEWLLAITVRLLRTIKKFSGEEGTTKQGGRV